jgi:hypothetical protein
MERGLESVADAGALGVQGDHVALLARMRWES